MSGRLEARPFKLLVIWVAEGRLNVNCGVIIQKKQGRSAAVVNFVNLSVERHSARDRVVLG
jgi:hypothetical protein